MKIEQLIKGYCTDWYASDLHDNEEPRIIPTCGQLRYLVKRIEELEAQIPKVGRCGIRGAECSYGACTCR